MIFVTAANRAISHKPSNFTRREYENIARTIFRRHLRNIPGLGEDAFLRTMPTSLRVRRVGPNLFRGAAPITPGAFESLVNRHKVKTIVSLLDPSNPKEAPLMALERQLAKRYGIKLHHVSMPFGKAPPKESLAQFLQIVRNPNCGPIFLHCRLGRDRTGTLVAVYRMVVEHASPSSALAEMKRSGYNPVRDPYLAYLGNFVSTFGQSLRRPSFFARLQRFLGITPTRAAS